MKMLIIDDEIDFCRLIKLMLLHEPFQVVCATNLSEASRLLEDQHPQIVFVDNNLPDGSGLDFILSHQALVNLSHTILITADPSPETRKRAREAGVYFLEKPFGLKKIRDAIKSVA